MKLLYYRIKYFILNKIKKDTKYLILKNHELYDLNNWSVKSSKKND